MVVDNSIWVSELLNINAIISGCPVTGEAGTVPKVVLITAG